MSSAARRSLLSETLNQVSLETLKISINLTGFLIRRLLTQQINLGDQALSVHSHLCFCLFTLMGAVYTPALWGSFPVLEITGNPQEWQGIKRAAGKLRVPSDSSRKPCDVHA